MDDTRKRCGLLLATSGDFTWPPVGTSPRPWTHQRARKLRIVAWLPCMTGVPGKSQQRTLPRSGDTLDSRASWTSLRLTHVQARVEQVSARAAAYVRPLHTRASSTQACQRVHLRPFGTDWLDVRPSWSLEYGAPLRRRARLARRAANFALRAKSHANPSIARAFWLDGYPNFGDAITPWLFERMGILPVHKQPQNAVLAGVGSIVEMLPKEYKGVIWGSGLIHDEPYSLPHATILALRGPLSRERLGAPADTPLGDPGLLVGRYLRRQRPSRRWRLGLVPHHLHRHDQVWRDLQQQAPDKVTLIDVRRGVTPVAHRIAACDAILSTSLHGLIVADSLGVPASWASPEPLLVGGMFKFHDYEGAVTPGINRLRQVGVDADWEDIVATASIVDPSKIVSIQNDLVRALRNFPFERPPWPMSRGRQHVYDA